MIPPIIAFLAWLPVSLYCFRRFPVRVAVLINFFAGWAVLPAACFVPSAAAFPYWILGVDLASTYFLTKASLPAITCLAGILLFHRSSISGFKVSLWDLPMLTWCLAPVLAALFNSQQALPALQAELYQCLVWGIPYLVGRLFCNDTSSLLLAAKAIVVAGLGYIPICIVEFFTGPQLYAHLYGYEPYRWVGAQRFIGYRPIGLLEDGNQLGIWMASSALIAIWLWRRRLAESIAGIPIAWAAAALFATTLLCQSVGSIVLLGFCLLFTFLRSRALLRVVALLLLIAIVTAIGLRLSNVISLRSLIEHNRFAYEAARTLKHMRLGTFGWRLSQDEQHVTSALRTPIVGSGSWDWWRATSSRPWSLWLLAFGMYGIVGLLALQSLQILPVMRTWRAYIVGGSRDKLELRLALSVIILMSAADNLLNGSMILPFLLVIGGLTTSVDQLGALNQPHRSDAEDRYDLIRNTV